MLFWSLRVDLRRIRRGFFGLEIGVMFFSAGVDKYFLLSAYAHPGLPPVVSSSCYLSPVFVSICRFSDLTRC